MKITYQLPVTVTFHCGYYQYQTLVKQWPCPKIQLKPTKNLIYSCVRQEIVIFNMTKTIWLNQLRNHIYYNIFNPSHVDTPSCPPCKIKTSYYKHYRRILPINHIWVNLSKWSQVTCWFINKQISNFYLFYYYTLHRITILLYVLFICLFVYSLSEPPE